MAIQRLSALEERIANLGGGPWYRRTEVAALLGVTPAAILGAGRSGLHPHLRARHCIEHAGRELHLYSEEDIDRLRKHFLRPNRGAGRPRMWTLTESATRRRKLDLARYYRRCVQTYLQQGDEAKAQQYQSKAEALSTQLDKQLEKRKAARAAKLSATRSPTQG